MEEKEYDETVVNLTEYAKSIRDLFAILKPNERSTVGFTFAMAGLIRLCASFDAAHLVVRQGYAIESIVIARFIHEQLAYIYSLRLTNSLEDIDSLQVPKCITKYKERISYIGNLYGMTSEFVHLDMRSLTFYLKSIDVKTLKGTVITKHKDKEIGYTMLLTLVMTVELYLDMVFVFLDVDGLRNNNQEVSERADKIKIQLEILIDSIKRSIC